MGGAVFETSSLEALRAFNETQRRAWQRRCALRRLFAHPPPPRPRRLEKATDTLGSGIGSSVAQNKFRR